MVVIRLIAIVWLALLAAVPAALAERSATQVPSTLVKVVILSRHGVRSPIPSRAELETWTASPWPVWNCAVAPSMKVCASGELTPRGAALAQQMGTYYRTYLTGLLPADQCPDAGELFLWADRTQRTEKTGLALLSGFRPKCEAAAYFHTAPTAPDRIFHPVTDTGHCKVNAARAEHDILARAGGSLSRVTKNLADELATAQKVLQCCQKRLCQATVKACRLPSPAIKACTLRDRLPSCLVPHPESGEPTEVLSGGALRVASTFAELLLLEYANGFQTNDVGWGRITREQMTLVFRLHTTAFDLEQRTPYVAKRQGSALVKKILLALEDKTDNLPGTAPVGAKFVAYVGHDTNISNVASMLGLSWLQPSYQKDQTPPAGALIFELHQLRSGLRYVSAFYVAQSLEEMRDLTGTSPRRTPVPIPGCSNEAQCPVDQFTKLAEQALDADCTQ
jgi:4-phytase/acid phosphatase